MFEIKNISKKYADAFALRQVSMTFDKGLHFIIGSSGSGKTTLLKIMSGMDQSFEGDVFYGNQSIKSLSEKEKSYLYNNIFGFVWQDFNLLDDLTVLENVMLPQYLKKKIDEKSAMKVLSELKITKLAHQKVSKLSGGQKQRVAIARELMKNPQVIIADEPTSALDENTSKTTMELLREISKHRTVIVVTHDTSLIDSNANVYELDKGVLVASPAPVSLRPSQINSNHLHKLSFCNSCRLSIQSIKSQLARLFTSTLSLIVAATLLLVTVSGSITGSGQNEFNHLMSLYGESLLDISLYNSFIDASGSANLESDNPSGSIDQNIKDLYDLYVDDPRVAFVAYLEAFDHITISVDGKDYSVLNSGSTPSINTLVAGKMPMGDKSEVVVPLSFVETLGLTPNDALGKEIVFKGDVTDWNNGVPLSKSTFTKVTTVGVMDTTIKYDYEGQFLEYTVDDSFLFSKVALQDMLKKVGLEEKTLNFLIRAKNPSDMIAIKDELNKQGIVPLGKFELIEDLVRLNDQTAKQSESATVIISLLSLVIVVAASFITAVIRRREYAIYKVSGFSSYHLSLLVLIESLMTSLFTSILFIAMSPIINFATMTFWDMNILNKSLLITGSLLVFTLALLSGMVTLFISVTTNTSKSLKTGDR